MQELNCTLILTTDKETPFLSLAFSLQGEYNFYSKKQKEAPKMQEATAGEGRAALPGLLKAQIAHNERLPHYSWRFTRLPQLCDVVRSFD